MPKKKKDYTLYNIEEIIGTISERTNSDWGKFLCKASYDDKPSTIDIRNLKVNTDGSFGLGKGIALSDAEVDSLTDLLVENGYGSSKKLNKAIQDRKKMYGFEEEDSFDGLVIDVR